MRRTTRRLGLLAVSAALLATGCGSTSSSGDGGTATTGRGTEIEISGLAFKPGALEVSAGTQVRWTNHDMTRHTVTAGTPDATGDAFDAELAEEGDDFVFTFDRTGAFPFFCRVHPSGMRGEITVG